MSELYEGKPSEEELKESQEKIEQLKVDFPAIEIDPENKEIKAGIRLAF